MKALTIVTHALNGKIKDYKSLAAIVLLPIVLTTLFSYVFASVDEILSGGQNKAMTISFELIIKEKEDNTLGEKYKTFLDTLNKEQIGLTLDYTSPKQQGETKAQVIVSEEDNQIMINTSNSEEQEALSEVSKQFADTMQLMDIALKYGKAQVVAPLEKGDFIKEIQIEDQEKVSMSTAIMVAMFIFSILMGSQYGVNQMNAMQSTLGQKLLTTPIKRGQWYFWEAVASFIMILLQAILFVFVYGGLFKLDFWSQGGQLILVIILLSLFAMTLGMAIGAYVKQEATAEEINSMAVIGICFLSGGFTPMIESSKFSVLSPVTGVSKALYEIIEGKPSEDLLGALLVLGGLSIILGVITYLRIRRGENV